MISVLYLCGIFFVIRVFRGAKIKNTEDQLIVSSVFASFVSITSKSNKFLPTPASAVKYIFLPYRDRVRGGTVQDDPAFTPEQTPVTNGSADLWPAVPVFIDLSLPVCKFLKPKQSQKE